MDRNGQQSLLPEVLWDEGLNSRQRQFVINFCTDKTCFLNATAAYVKTFTRSGKELANSSIQSNASRMMRNDKIKTAINTLLRVKQDDEDRIDEYRLLHYIKTLAYYNPADIINKYGELLTKNEDGKEGSLHELGDLAICIEGIKKGKYGKEIKLKDRYKALEMLANYLGVVRTPESNTIINPVVLISKKDIEALRMKEAPEESTAQEADADFEYVNNEEEGLVG